VALVTGGAGRLGRAICAAFAREGANVAVVDRAAGVHAFARDLERAGVRARAVEADVSSTSGVERMLRDVADALGPVDVLVNAHGVYPNVPLLEMSDAEWDDVFAVNARGTMLTCRAVAQQMVARGAAGSIVNISSAAADSPRAGGAAYSGSKAAVNMLTNVLAMELGPSGIRVNAVAPGLVLDEVYRPGDAHAYEYVMQSIDSIPMRRTGAPEDVAELVVFLSGRNNPWLSGAIVPITGGSHTGRTHVALSRGLR
jgi:NAD(P)-dependent dehydrogenase (short-subunit alcohol dehydrogenase family)